MSNRVKGIMSILFASMGFAFMSIFVKMSGDLPTVQKVIFRNLISMIIAFFMITIHFYQIETVFIITDSENMFLSSSVVKQVCEYGGDITSLVPEAIREDIVKGLRKEV